jgi:hypothetical protein
LELRLMRHDHVFTGTAEVRGKAFDDHWKGILNAAAGGDIAAMTRPEIDLALDPNAKPADVAVEGESGGILVDLVLSGTPWEQEFQAMIDMTKSNYERRVGIQDELTLESMLKEGEAMPPEELQLLYAMLRGSQAMEFHCRETLVEIASKCQALTSRVLKVEGGKYLVDVTFGYVPNYAIGALEKNSGWAFVSAFLPDTDARGALDTPKQRRNFLRRLMKVCDKLREEKGNCVISTAGIYLDRAASFSGGGGNAWAAGWVSVYSPDNPFEEQQLKERAEEIWARTK